MRYTLAVIVFLGIGLSSANGQDPTWNTRTDGVKRPVRTGDESVQVPANGHVEEQVPFVSGGGTITVNELRMPGKAMKELVRSDRALRGGDVRGSAEHLEKALTLYPNVAEVHNALGVRYTGLKEYEKAVEEFEKAVALNPRYRLAVDNICGVLCMQHRYAEAEPVARRALEIEPEAASSQYLLGSILVEEGHSLKEGIALLERAKDKHPRARLFLAKAKAQLGEVEEAEGELREYLRLPNAAEKTLAQDWLGRMEEYERMAKQQEGERKVAEAGGAVVH